MQACVRPWPHTQQPAALGQLGLVRLTTAVWHRLHKRYTSCFCHGSSGASRAWRVQEKGEQKQLACWHAGQAPPQAGDAARGFVQIDAFCHEHGEHGEKRRRVLGRASRRDSARRCPCRGRRGQPRQPSYHRLVGGPWAVKAAHIAAGGLAGVQGSTLQPAWLGLSITVAPVLGLLLLRCAVPAQ